MLSREGKQTDRGAVGAEFIGYNRRRREALLLQEFPHQPNCRPSVPAGLNQEIQDFALTVHGTPEIELPPSNYDDHLVQVPAFGRSWPPTLNPPRIGPTEFQDPSSNCLIRDVETTLGKQVLNVPIAQRETAIEPDSMLDDDRWKAVTTVGYLAHPETLKHRPCRSHAVNVTMPFGPLPTDPDEQNALWVKWLNEFSDDIRVVSTYGMYLFTRDWTAISATTLCIATPVALWVSDDTIQALSYAGFLLLQYVFAAWVARVQGDQLVMSVMSCKGTSLNSRPRDKKKSRRVIMTNFIEIDFIEPGDKGSGDAITIRHRLNSLDWIYPAFPK